MSRLSVLAIAFLALALLALAGAKAHEYRHQDLVLLHPWARASAGAAKVGVVYLTIRNRGNQVDRLIGASTPACERVQMHQLKNSGSVMAMAALAWIDLAPGGEIRLAPNGAHLMLIGLRHGLKQGDRFPLTLNFERAGEAIVEIEVQGIADLAPAH